MLSFTYHDCIFFQYVKERQEEALKIIRDTRNLVEKKNEKQKCSERYVYARWIKDFFFSWLLSDIWKLYMCTLMVRCYRKMFNVYPYRPQQRQPCLLSCRTTVSRKASSSFYAILVDNFQRVESSCSWIIDYETHIYFSRDHPNTELKKKKCYASFTSVFKCSTFYRSFSYTVWMFFVCSRSISGDVHWRF